MAELPANPTPPVHSRGISPRWLGGSARPFRRLCFRSRSLAEMSSFRCQTSGTSQKNQLRSPSSRPFAHRSSSGHESASALPATAKRGSALRTDAARTLHDLAVRSEPQTPPRRASRECVRVRRKKKRGPNPDLVFVLDTKRSNR